MEKIDQITNGPVSYLNLKCMRYISHLLYFNLTLNVRQYFEEKKSGARLKFSWQSELNHK